MDFFNGNKNLNQSDRFSSIMFPKKEKQVKEEEPAAPGSIDYMQLMESVDTLMTIYGEFKPALSKLNPLILQTLKKFEKKG
ncbi:hypothetical protein SAMN05443252_101264 [Bacillus sp. OV322]|uniref:hypothetical protein n=1 Tax=Bacillus sp. OV322 TaxID=1882764 RepID=UPI0008F24D56|nr:hypothetical protein [Bacillus sp. OV322]SFB97546.1 hypothetical protein SAMN05443252_101264 [Bacillus sp. OV322]